jgi:3-oxoacyl-[acyl-carrier protein] reductase
MIVFMEAPGKKAEGDPFPLSGKRALVVGGTGGIGREVSSLLYAKGAQVLLHGRSAEKARALIRSLETDVPAGPSRASFIEYAIEPESVADFVRTVARSGRIDILVLSFGPFLRKPLAATTPDDWTNMAMLNLALPGALISACLPGMLDSGYGRILLFGGTLTDQIRGFTGNAAYAAAKTGLGSLVKSAAYAGAGRGVSAVLVCPGLVDTEYPTPAEKAAWAEKAPGKRLIPASELAERALSIALDDSGTYNGALVAMDGGLRFG